MMEPTQCAPHRPAPAPLAGFEHINRYWDRVHGSYAAKLLPGEFYVTRHDEIITTVLGSCVSACIWDPESRIGGMNHFMLPADLAGSGSWGALEAIRASTRYGTYAMEKLINEALKAGAIRKNLLIKVFGGGKIIAKMSDVGLRNIAFIRQYIKTEGLQLVAEDLGDIHPRKVVFFPDSGRVRVKKLRSLHNDTLLQREEAYRMDLEETPVQGEIELF